MTRFAMMCCSAMLFAGAAEAADSAGSPPPVPATNAAPAATASDAKPAETWQQRQQRLLQERQVQEQAAAIKSQMNRPTAWQLQNPSGIQNRTPTEPTRGYTAPNNYFGPQQRTWSNMSPPTTMSQVPPNYFTPAPAIFSNVQLAPNTYNGAANQSWSNLRPAGATPNSLGGWNYAPGN